MTLIFATDHGGFALKESLLNWSRETLAADTIDMGAYQLQADDDYPDFAHPAAQAVSQAAGATSQDNGARPPTTPSSTPSPTTPPPTENPHTFGIFLCRSGGGMAIVANRYPGVRAVVCRTQSDAQHAREHDNANVIVLQGDHVAQDAARELLQTFISTPFAGGRHAQRVANIERGLATPRPQK